VRADASAAPTAATLKSQHEMTVCNSCRYCEAYCPVFQAMEERLTFSSGDVAYLANLCHNCGECLYACQYAPPHEFGIDVPATFSALRVESYAAAAWPAFAARAFRWPWATATIALAVSALIIPIVAAPALLVRESSRIILPADFYGVIPHAAMVWLFGIVGLFAVVALIVGYRRFAILADLKSPHSTNPESRLPADLSSEARSAKLEARRVQAGIPNPVTMAARDALTLKHLHATGEDCVDALETRRPWRRWMHHCTFYGFGLCFASTTVAAIYHVFFGWIAPYAYTSLPVILGTLGGLGLLIGPAGLFAIDRQRDSALTHSAQRAIDTPFLAMLFLTSATGLLLLALRARSFMPQLLIVHLACVLALFITLPYGKFVHGIYRAAALVKFRRENNH